MFSHNQKRERAYDDRYRKRDGEQKSCLDFFGHEPRKSGTQRTAEVAEKREYSEHFGSALRKVFPRELVRPRPQQTDEQTRKGYTRKRKIRRRRKGGQQIRSRK